MYPLLALSDIQYVHVFFSPDARVIRRGLLRLWGCRSLEDRPLLLQTRPRGSHCHGNGELHNRPERGTWEGRTCPILCQWTPECLFSHLSPGCCSLGCDFGSGNGKEKHFVDLHQLRKFRTRLKDWEADWVRERWWKTVVSEIHWEQPFYSLLNSCLSVLRCV